MPFRDDEVLNFAKGVGDRLRQSDAAIEELRSGPARQRMEREWAEGRRHAEAKGYRGAELTRLEDAMVARGVASHVDMIQLDTNRPTAMFPEFEDPDARKRLMDGDTEGFLDAMIPKILRDERGF